MKKKRLIFIRTEKGVFCDVTIEISGEFTRIQGEDIDIIIKTNEIHAYIERKV